MIGDIGSQQGIYEGRKIFFVSENIQVVSIGGQY